MFITRDKKKTIYPYSTNFIKEKVDEYENAGKILEERNFNEKLKKGHISDDGNNIIDYYVAPTRPTFDRYMSISQG